MSVCGFPKSTIFIPGLVRFALRDWCLALDILTVPWDFRGVWTCFAGTKLWYCLQHELSHIYIRRHYHTRPLSGT